MGIKIYNTLTRQKEEFKPLRDGEVRMYVCGPTVYDYTHIGHARTYIAFDVIRRYLEHKGYTVLMVMNFTDIDDKIIKRANETGEDPKELAEKFLRYFLEDMKALKVKPADIYPRVTEHIQDIIDFIRKLQEKGYAYEGSDGVYFEVKKFKDYGKLSKIKLEDLVKARALSPARARRTRRTLPSGRRPNQGSQSGRAPPGAREGPAGT